MNYRVTILTLATILTLTGCGGSSSSSPEQPETPETPTSPAEGQIYGPFSTGTSSEPETVYFDLDSQSTVALTTAEAATDTTWDIAFQRTKIWLNTSQETPVSMFKTANNSDFYDADGNPVAELFLAATAESELADYEAVTLADAPPPEAFTTDEQGAVIGDSFYHYDMTTHTVTAADDVYYIVNSDSNFTRFRVTDIQTTGNLIAEITLAIAHQSMLDGQSEFADEIELTLQTEACGNHTYIDFDTQTTATVAEDWDLIISCGDGGAEFELTLADDATVIRTDGQTYAGIDSQAAPFMGFTPDTYTEYAFDETPWYFYDSTTHLLYSQFSVYLIKAGDNTYKFQITSYYDDAGTSGSYSVRADLLAAQ
ncbi:HmuY family protein [Alteromonas gilva]|uniref:HmuY family protein n=1 Tax=Alteromonas gilva TaxID=2987522 RepID=A0ABT5KZE2_9ALTE|nr:HmuY family protein [Alteromonas gilva]MDC8830012.1 HmuY family protein [Alteromonas gilva]